MYIVYNIDQIHWLLTESNKLFVVYNNNGMKFSFFW